MQYQHVDVLILIIAQAQGISLTIFDRNKVLSGICRQLTGYSC